MPDPLPLSHAIDLAGNGWQCFPCRADKRPATPNGFYAATRNPAELNALFRRYRGPLVGIRTGGASDLAVLDLDTGKGAATWWLSNRPLLPRTWTVRTRSGGLHLYFRHRPGLRCSASIIAPGVDVRADGGYVISWPGAGFPVLDDVWPASWPALLLPAAKPRIQGQIIPLRVPDDRSLAGLVRLVANAAERERNSKLFWAACRAGEAIRAGTLTETAAIAVLTEAATRAGLSEIEAHKTAASGVQTGLHGGSNG